MMRFQEPAWLNATLSMRMRHELEMAKLNAPDEPCGMMWGEDVYPDDPRIPVMLAEMEASERESERRISEVRAMAQARREELEDAPYKLMSRAILLIGIAFALAATPAFAQANPADAYSRFMGQHQQRQPQQVPYHPPPQSNPYIRPLPIIPPMGTRQCTPVYVCSQVGQCVWQQVCR